MALQNAHALSSWRGMNLNSHFLILQNDFYSVEENLLYTLEQSSISALKNDIKHLLSFNYGLSL